MRVLHSATRSLFGIVLIGLAVAGCSGDSTAPNAPFDPAGTNSDMDGMSNAFSAGVMESYLAASAQISSVAGGSVSAAIAAAPTASIARDHGAAMKYAASLAKRYVSTGSALRPSFSTTAASIPAEYAGVTFVYDVGTHGYVASDLTGAPSNGVRFLLYSVNPITGEITEPLNQVGYADIITTETSTSASVQVKLVSGGVTYLDYTVAASGSATSVTLSVSGYATNGTDRANFDLDHHLTGNDQSFTLGIDYLLTVPTRGGFRIEMDGSIVISGSQEVVSLDLEARGEHGTVRIEGSETDGTGNYEVFVNGELFATITITAGGEPVVNSAAGTPLTTEERLTVLGVFGIFFEGSIFFTDLLEPVS